MRKRESRTAFFAQEFTNCEETGAIFTAVIVIKKEMGEVMRDNTYANIFVCYKDADRDILTKQIRMLKERYHSDVIMVITSEDDTDFLDKHTEVFDDAIEISGEGSLIEAVQDYCRKKHLDEDETTLIAEFPDMEQLKDIKIEIKSPGAMAESYKKALEMLGNMMKPRM